MNKLCLKCIIGTLLVFLFIQCNPNKENQIACDYSIPIDIHNVSELDLEKIAKLHSIIPLETSNEILIGIIENVFLTDSLIIIWDSKTQIVYAFDYQGNYKHKIGKKGPGAEEYVELSGMYVDYEEQKIYLSDTATRRIMIYNFQGNFLSCQKIENYIFSFIPYGNGYWGINAGQNPNNYNLIYINQNADIECGFFPIDGSKLHLIPTNNFSINENHLLFHYPYSNVLYKIEEKKINPYIYVDFGEKGISYEKLNSDALFNTIHSLHYLGEITKVYFHKDKLFFSFLEYSGNEIVEAYYCYTSLNNINPVIYTHKIKHAKELIISPVPQIVNLSNSKLIFQIIPDILPETLLDKYKNTIYENIITSDSNPVLVLYDLIE